MKLKLNLVQYFLLALTKKRMLSLEESDLVHNYLQEKLPLIRDLANARLWRF
jgi:hypothetical protein